MQSARSPQIIFISGTDTGVGKTILTALLLSHLRQTSVPAFALKPFCSGGRADAQLLHSLQNNEILLDEINPFHFSEPLAPLVAARLHDRKITLPQTVRHIQQIRTRLISPLIQKSKNPKIQFATPLLHHSITPFLLIEGAGGLFSPLGEKFNLLDVILATSSIKRPASNAQKIIVVAPNRLGAINHTLLTIRALQNHGIRKIEIVLVDILAPLHSTPDTRSNLTILTELLSPIPLFRLPYLGKSLGKTERIRLFAKKHKKTLAQILA